MTLGAHRPKAKVQSIEVCAQGRRLAVAASAAQSVPLSLSPRASYTVTATGQVSCHGPIGPSSPCLSDPNGITYSAGPGYAGIAGVNVSPYPCGWAGACWAAVGLPSFSLVGRIGESGTPFFVGSGPITLTGSGELYLTYNDWLYSDNSGGYSVTVAQTLNLSSCQQGGWKNYGVFTNQGDCVSFVATGGKNTPGFDGKGK